MEGMQNLFDAATLLVLAFMIFSLKSVGNHAVTNNDATSVKTSGASDVEITKQVDGKTQRMKTTTETVSGEGSAIGTVYKLKDGSTVWVPKE